jgi:di/tricarboxylate transporter
VNLNFWQWLKIGAPFTVITIAASSLFIWLVWRN